MYRQRHLYTCTPMDSFTETCYKDYVFVHSVTAEDAISAGRPVASPKAPQYRGGGSTQGVVRPSQFLLDLLYWIYSLLSSAWPRPNFGYFHCPFSGMSTVCAEIRICILKINTSFIYVRFENGTVIIAKFMSQ